MTITITTVAFSLFSHSLRLFSKPLSSSSSSFSSSPSFKRCCFSLFSHRRSELCTLAKERKHEEKMLELPLPTNESSFETLLKIRHTCAYVMAMAVEKLYPNATMVMAGIEENQFYYDFVMSLKERDLKKIKKKMDCIIGQNLPIFREEVSTEEAKRRLMAAQNQQPYKLDILDEMIWGDIVTIYHIGDEWWDICDDPKTHVLLSSTGLINEKAVELEAIHEFDAYWRGHVHDTIMLQRIYGTAWESEEQLKSYLHSKEEARLQHHRRIGKGLFSIHKEAAGGGGGGGGGVMILHPTGVVAKQNIENTWKTIHIQSGYQLINTNTTLHDDNMEYENCFPYYILGYKREMHSYEDFPIKLAKLGSVDGYEKELCGCLDGLFGVRGLTHDVGHIFCLEDQIKHVIMEVLDLTQQILGRFGFLYFEISVCTRPRLDTADKVKVAAVNEDHDDNDDNMWEKATSALKDALDDALDGWSYDIDDDDEEGGGAFYGPKIDIKIIEYDVGGRKWPCSTIQVDFTSPQQYDITYADYNSEKKRPIMIHYSVLGCLERFLGILVEEAYYERGGFQYRYLQSLSSSDPSYD